MVCQATDAINSANTHVSWISGAVCCISQSLWVDKMPNREEKGPVGGTKILMILDVTIHQIINYKSNIPDIINYSLL